MTAAVVAAAVAALTVLMVMVVAVDIGIIAEVSDQQRRDRRVRLTADAAVELDARLCQRGLRAAADAAADQSVHAALHEEARQRAMAAAVGVDHLCADDLAVRYVVELELRRVAKVLEDHAVFIGNCDFHGNFSFIFVFAFAASGDTALPLLSAADAAVSAADAQRLPVDEAGGDLAPRALVDLLHGRAGNVHLRGALLVRPLL